MFVPTKSAIQMHQILCIGQSHRVIADGVAEHAVKDGLGERVEVGEGLAAFGAELVGLVQDGRNPPLLIKGGRGSVRTLTSSDLRLTCWLCDSHSTDCPLHLGLRRTSETDSGNRQSRLDAVERDVAAQKP